MLLASGVPLPKTIFAHGWWLQEDTKMSKSIGNVVKPLDLIDEFGVDPLRYFLMRDMVLGMDANFSMDSFVKRYNSDLANDFGNLVNRVTMLIKKHFSGEVPKPGTYSELDIELINKAKSTPVLVHKNIEELKIHDALENTISMIRLVNAYLENRAPWKLVKESTEQESLAATTLYVALEVLRIGSQLLQPVMPERIRTILVIIGATDVSLTKLNFGILKPGTKLGEGKSPFPRIQTKK
jgi:methionyl-tRNA synthetase